MDANAVPDAGLDHFPHRPVAPDPTLRTTTELVTARFGGHGNNWNVQRVRRWGLLVWAVAAVLAENAAAPHRVAAQRADNGLEEQTVNSFELDPSRGVVRVTIDISLRNVTTDRDEGNVVRWTYFDTYAVAVPLGAENVVATRDGSVLAGELISEPGFPAFSTYRSRSTHSSSVASRPRSRSPTTTSGRLLATPFRAG